MDSKRLFLVTVIFLGAGILGLSAPSVASHGGGHVDDDLGKGILQTGICPQKRHTPSAPEEYLKKKNPLAPTRENILAGKTLFYFDAKPHACKVCHGLKGNGLGVIYKQLDPKPRNFTCYETMRGISDGQMFWIIQNGSPGTAMPPFKGHLEEDQIWQLILFLRSFSAGDR